VADLGEIPAGSGEKSLNGVKNLDIGVADVLSLRFVKQGVGKYDSPAHYI
jgi:hypothetical protein